jgi:hypothetical protein
MMIQTVGQSPFWNFSFRQKFVTHRATSQDFLTSVQHEAGGHRRGIDGRTCPNSQWKRNGKKCQSLTSVAPTKESLTSATST